MDIGLAKEKVNFSSSVYKPSLKFKNPIYEQKYQQKRMRKKNIFILIVISLLFSFLMQ